jgi:hypothetical protein
MLRSEILEHRRLHAPSADGGTLIDPPLADAAALMRQNIAAREQDCDVQGRSLNELIGEVRGQLVATAAQYTRQYCDVAAPVVDAETQLVLAGHQPQLFHPGVWYKNFVLARLGSLANTVAVNLIIDSDTSKSAALHVPGGSVEEPTSELVAFDQVSEPIPFEERSILDRGCLESFGTRAYEQVRSLVPDPLVREFWPLVVERSRQENNLGLCLAQGRHLQEARFGVSTLELPQSQVCQLPAFHWFTSHLLANLPRLWETYNGAVAEYRRANHLRSKSHPVPDLAAVDQWLEAPYWVWTRENPLRRGLFVRSTGDELLLTDRHGLEFALPLAPDGDASKAVDVLAGLAERGIKLRTRALITTMFARLVLGDLFLHGIGGAKYDEVTDLVIQRFFGLQAPGYLTVTATQRLPMERPAASPDDLRHLTQRLRELDFHPEHYLAAHGDTKLAGLIAEKRHWVATAPSRETAKHRCRAIRHANEAMQPWTGALRRQWSSERSQLASRLEAASVLDSREYAFCLYPETTLRELASRV